MGGSEGLARVRSWPQETKARAVRLMHWGLNDTQIAMETGVPKRTFCDWRRQEFGG